MGRNLAIAAGIAIAVVIAFVSFLLLTGDAGFGDRGVRSGPAPRGEALVEEGTASPPTEPAPVAAAVASAGSAIDLAGGSGALRGTVLDPAGSPAPGAEVILHRSRLPAEVEQEGGLPILRVIALGSGPAAFRELARSVDIPFRPEIARGLERLAAVRADESGRFEFTGVPSGRYLLSARAEGTLETPSPAVHHVEAASTEVVLATIAAADLTGSVHGEDGSAIAGAQVRVRGEIVPLEAGFAAMFIPRGELLLHLLNPPSGVTLSDDDGRFRIAGLPPLEYRIYVDAAPWAAAELRHALPELAPAQVVLAPGGTIDGIVLDHAGAPLPGASLALSLDEGGSTPLEALLRPLPTAISAADGTFRFEGLAEAGYRVDAAAAGWQSGAARGLTVAAGEETAAEIVLVAGAALEGSVRDEAGNAIADAEVESRPGGGAPVASARTDARGAFRLDTLPEGTHRLRARKPGWVEAEVEAPTGEHPVEIVLSPGATVRGRFVDARGAPVARVRVAVERNWEHAIVAESDAGGEFTAQLSEREGIRLRARAAGFAEAVVEVPDDGGDLGDILISPAARIAGVVLDPEGSPLPGARVTARRERENAPVPAPGRGESATPRLSAAWSDAEGSFALEVDDPRGAYLLSAHYALLLPSAEVRVAAGSAASERVELSLRYGAAIEGTVLGAGGSPLDGAIIELREVRERGGGARRTARTSAGAFRIAGLEAATYALRASAVRHAETVEHGIALADDEVRHVDLRLAPEQRLVGRVVDDRGGGIEGARVGVAEDGGARRSATSDSAGAFVVERLGRGSLDVTVEAAGFLRHREGGIVAAAGTVEFALRTAHELRGLVLDQGTELPIAGARLRLRTAGEGEEESRRGRDSWSRTDDSGEFLLRDLDVGEYVLVASAEGYIPFEVPEVRIPRLPSEGEPTILLRAGGRIRGVVHDAVGRTLEEASIRAFRIEEESDAESGKSPRPRSRRGRAAAQARSDARGEFALIGLPEGRYEVTIDHEAYLPAVEQVHLALDRPEPAIAVSLERGAEIEGRVYGATGALVGRGNVVVEGPVRRRVRVEDGGRFRVAGLPEGTYRVRFLPSDATAEPSGTVTVELRPRQERTVDLTP